MKLSSRCNMPSIQPVICILKNLTVPLMAVCACSTDDPAGGNGKIEAGEECDDGNAVDGDGCEATCSSSCGNGTVDLNEECDDRNDVDNDDCSTSCAVSLSGHAYP